MPDESVIRSKSIAKGFNIVDNTINISMKDGLQTWRYNAIAIDKYRPPSLTGISNYLVGHEGIESYEISRIKV